MARRGWEDSGKEKVTIKGRLVVEDKFVLAKLLYTMRLFRDSVEMAYRLMKKEGLSPQETTKRVTKFISNAHYAYSAVKRAVAYLEQERLNLRRPQLYSVGKACERGNRNIRLMDTDKVLIKIPHADGRHEWAEFKVRFGKKHVPIVEELTADRGVPYSASIVLSDDGKYYLHLCIPLELYAKHTARVKVNSNAYLTAGFDVNPDRVCMVIVDFRGRIRDVRARHFPEVVLPGFPRGRARDLRLKALSELIDYACRHSVKYFVFEKIKAVRRRKSSKKANRKVSRFAYRELLQHAEVMVRKRGGVFVQVSPAYTSIDAKPLSTKLGLDVHATSAYLLALRYLKIIDAY